MRSTWRTLGLVAGVMGVAGFIAPQGVEARGFGTPTVDGVKDAIYGASEATDGTGAPQGNANMDLGQLSVVNDANYWYFHFSVNANIASPNNWGKYLLYIDTDGVAASGATSDAWGRNVRVLDPHKPEFSINGWVDSGVYGANHTQVWSWSGGAWVTNGSGQVDAAGLTAGTTSGIEWKIARSRLGDRHRFGARCTRPAAAPPTTRKTPPTIPPKTGTAPTGSRSPSCPIRPTCRASTAPT